MDKARIGFVGCGSHSTHNLYPAIRFARASLEAVCDQNAELAERNRAAFGGKACYASVDEMLDRVALDGVMVVGPPELHYEAGMKALERGIAVFVEKPTAPDSASVETMVRTAKANNTTLMTGFMKRHGSTYWKIRDEIKAGAFVPNACLMKYTHWPTPTENLRSMLLFMSSHPIDLVLSFFGKPSRLQCSLGVGERDWATLGINITFPNRRLAQLQLGSQVRIQEHFEISGLMGDEPGYFLVDNVTRLERHTQSNSGIDLGAPTLDAIDPTVDLSGIAVWRPDFGIPNMSQTRLFFQGFVSEVREFCNAIIDDREPWPNGEDALLTMRVIEAIASTPDGITEFDTQDDAAAGRGTTR